MEKLCLILVCLSFCIVSCQPKQNSEEKGQPNIVYILADDLGYGDVSAYNPGSKISTPNIDRLITQGMRFTDAHSPSSVCTPTRYGILTGRYCWRTKLPKGVLTGYGQPLIEKQETTVAELLLGHGYQTGIVGKWHLGLDWKLKEEFNDSISEDTFLAGIKGEWIDIHKAPTNGPSTQGFGYSYILPASLDMEPYCYLENDQFVNIPNDYTPGNKPNGYTGAFWREGHMAPDFDFHEVLPNFIVKAKDFIKDKSGQKAPFFLYLPLAAPHTPWMPKENFVGKSDAGEYGDFVTMVDAAIGEVLDQLDQSGVAENTLVIFTSDNGPYWQPEFEELFDHQAAYIYRGMKADAWDGGHRIPFVVRWPGKVEANSQSDYLTTLTNLTATVADILGISLQKRVGMDSKSIYPVLMGEADDSLQTVVHHSSKGMFAIRSGEWKYIEGLGSGGFSLPSVVEAQPGEAPGQLYNMREDPSEKNNLYDAFPEKVAELKVLLEGLRNAN